MAERHEIRETGKYDSAERQFASVVISMSPAEQASIDGRRVGGWVSKKTTLSAGVVLTDSDILYAIPSGKRLVVKQFFIHLHTASDELEIVLGVTANADGSGAFTAKSIPIPIETGTVAQTARPSMPELAVPLSITQDDGLAFTIKATTNDDAASVSVGWAGYYETINPDTDLRD